MLLSPVLWDTDRLSVCCCQQFSWTQTDSLCMLLSLVLWDTDRLCACCCHQFSWTQTDSLCVLLSPVLWDTVRHSVRATVTSSLGHRQTLCACYCHQFSGIYLSHMFTVRSTFCHSWQCPVLFITSHLIHNLCVEQALACRMSTCEVP